MNDEAVIKNLDLFGKIFSILAKIVFFGSIIIAFLSIILPLVSDDLILHQTLPAGLVAPIFGAIYGGFFFFLSCISYALSSLLKKQV